MEMIKDSVWIVEVSQTYALRHSGGDSFQRNECQTLVASTKLPAVSAQEAADKVQKVIDESETNGLLISSVYRDGAVEYDLTDPDTKRADGPPET